MGKLQARLEKGDVEEAKYKSVAMMSAPGALYTCLKNTKASGLGNADRVLRDQDHGVVNPGRNGTPASETIRELFMRFVEEKSVDMAVRYFTHKSNPPVSKLREIYEKLMKRKAAA